ncbi:MAG TPA: DegT/DnrJ/EryC1/StrS family aminotransferase [Pyrinomonadaceae bacterium]
MKKLQVPFFRPALQEAEVSEVVSTLRSGWLTSGPKVKRFETDFAAAVGNGSGKAKLHAVALNSGTAALHLAVEALGLKPGEGVLVPTMTFAATAEVVRYQGAIPILVDCDPDTLNPDLEDAERRLQSAKGRGLKANSNGYGKAATKIVGIMPVHVGGKLMDLALLESFAASHRLWVVEDSAHAFPSRWRPDAHAGWRQRSNGSRSVTCYSFYANKTITTGEGGMAVTSNHALAERIRLMSLHGLSADAWGRYSTNGKWDYKIVAPGYKYNLTDIAAAIGIHQLERAETMRGDRERIALRYLDALAGVAHIELPQTDKNRSDSWHLFPIKLHLKSLKITRDAFMDELKKSGVGCSVHWRPLHLHPYYQKTFGWRARDFPVATAQWKRLISLPIFPGMRDEEIEHVIETVKRLCTRHAR